MGVFLLIMIKGIFETLNPAGTFLLPMSNFFDHQFIAYFACMVSPHGYHTSGVTSPFEPKVTRLNEDYVVLVLCI